MPTEKTGRFVISSCKSALHCSRLAPCYCGFCFSIHHCPYGVLVSARVPFKDSCSILQYYADEYGYDICDAVIAHHFNCATCLTTRELSREWKVELGID